MECEDGVNIVMVGNPGCGKSTLLNTLHGQKYFRSGVSRDGNGITKEYKCLRVSREEPNFILTDTPGVSEIGGIQKNLFEIQQALTRYGQLKLLFVIVLEMGEIRALDIAVMTTILEGFAQSKTEDITNRYGIIINKCHEDLILHREEIKAKFTRQFNIHGVAKTSQFHFIKSNINAIDSNDFILLDEKEPLWRFCLSASSIKISSLIALHKRVYNRQIDRLLGNGSADLSQHPSSRKSLPPSITLTSQQNSRAYGSSKRSSELRGSDQRPTRNGRRNIGFRLRKYFSNMRQGTPFSSNQSARRAKIQEIRQTRVRSAVHDDHTLPEMSIDDGSTLTLEPCSDSVSDIAFQRPRR